MRLTDASNSHCMLCLEVLSCMSGSRRDIAQGAPICGLKGLQVLGEPSAELIGSGSIQGAAVVFAKLLGRIESYQRLAFTIYYPILAVQVTASLSYCEPLTFELTLTYRMPR